MIGSRTRLQLLIDVLTEGLREHTKGQEDAVPDDELRAPDSPNSPTKDRESNCNCQL